MRGQRNEMKEAYCSAKEGRACGMKGREGNAKGMIYKTVIEKWIEGLREGKYKVVKRRK